MKRYLFIALLISFSLTNAQSLEWAKALGGGLINVGYGVTVDNYGNVYTTGSFMYTVDFDPGPGVFNVTANSSQDIFITKLDVNGNFVWAKTMGGIGKGSNAGVSIALDNLGNVYTTGYFSDTTDFDPGAGTFNLTALGEFDIFISKLDSSGNFLWARAIGNKTMNQPRNMFVDKNNVYITGTFTDTIDFDPGLGTTNLTSAGESDAFILKLDTSGNYIWVRSVGGVNPESSTDIVADATGNIYTTGYFRGIVDFNPDTSAVNNLTSSGLYNVFILKLDSSGNYVWAKTVGGTANDFGSSITLDTLENICILGSFEGVCDLDPGIGVANFTSSSTGMFMLKLDTLGNYLWAKSITNIIAPTALQTDVRNNWYITGYYQGTSDFDPSNGINYLSSRGMHDIFILKLDDSGNYKWAISLGGTSYDRGLTLAVDTSSNVYVSGYYQGIVDFDPSVGVFNLPSAYVNAFTCKINSTTLSSVQYEIMNTSVHLYPNPTDGTFQLNTTENLIGATLQIHNVLGQMVLEQVLTENNPTIHFEANKGMYLVKVVNNDKLLLTTKIIKQ